MKPKEIRRIEQKPIEAQFKWKIADFFSVTQDENIQQYESQRFQFQAMNFQFVLYPRSGPYPGFMKLCLTCYYWPFYCEFSGIEYCYGFETPDGDVQKVVRGILKERNRFFNRCIFKLSEIQERESELAPSGVVTIICKLKYHISSSQTIVPEEPKRKKLRKLDTLSENFKSLFVNKESCDVTVRVMDKEYKAHSTVLMARSSVFAAMFQHKTSQKKTTIITRHQKRKSQKMVTIPGGTITVSDCDSLSFELFLKYLYSGEIEELSTQTAFHLHEISNKYKVWDLATLCKQFLKENLTVENVFDVGILADKYRDSALLRESINFFCRNVDKIRNKPVWDSFMESNLFLSKTYYGGNHGKNPI